MKDKRTPQEKMSNNHAGYGNRYAKPVTTGRIMVQNMQETGPRPLSLDDDAEIIDSSKEFILHLLQISGPRRKRLQNDGADAGKNIRCIQGTVEIMTGQVVPQFNQAPTTYNTAQQQYNTVQQPYNNVQPQYKPTQPQYNTMQYNQAPQYNVPRGD
jgi:hypothetical protein